MSVLAKDSKQLISIDLLRGLAAFSVYYYHQHLGALMAKYSNLELLEYTDSIGANYAVPLFFLISGFCIQLSNHKYAQRKASLDLKKYYFNRFWRLYPPYLVALLLAITVNAITTWQPPVTAADFFVHFFTLQGYISGSFNSINIVLWTITVEIAFYMIYPLYYYLHTRFSANTALACSALISLLSIIWFGYRSVDITLPERYFFANLWFGWCFGSWICATMMDNPQYFSSVAWKILSGLLLIMFFLLFLPVNAFTRFLHYDMVYIVVWAPFLVFLIRKEDILQARRKYLRVPVLVGLSSYSLYLIHHPLIDLKNYLIHLTENDTLKMILMILSIILVPLISYWFYLIFEKPFITYKKAAYAG